MMRVTSFFVLTVLWVQGVYGLDMHGTVVNDQGEPLAGVSVITDVAGRGTISDEAGGYTVTVDENVTRVTFSRVGYQSRQFDLVDVRDTVILQPLYYPGEKIIVTAHRARSGVSPIAFSNFSREEIARDYTVGEFPLLLKTTPNLFTYTDGGSPLGYVYTSIRGFDDKRITTYINGVPLNDPEWQQTFYVDLPDFAANVDDIQVQRGIGNSLYGEGSFGGTINVVTSALSRDRSASLTAGYGQFTSGGKAVSDLYKQSIGYSSGLIDGRWHFGGRFSRQRSAGFVERSWYQGWSYYFSVARIDPNMTTELYLYGGPIKTHLAFFGADRSAIDRNRRYNPQTYDNETDNFNQPHYQLHNTYRLSDRMTLSNTLYYVRGKGYFEVQAPDALMEDFGIDSGHIAIDTSTGQRFASSDVVRQDHVHKNQWGWNPRLDIDHERGRHSVGAAGYYFESTHFGNVTWAQHVIGELDPGHQFYRWYGRQWVGSVYAEELYDVAESWTVQATVQLRYQRFELDERRMGKFLGHGFSVDWLFLSPRAGVSYHPSNRLSFFSNLAVSSRPPNAATIYDGTSPHVLPLLEVESVNEDSTAFEFGDPLIAAERVFDFELGARFRDPLIDVGLTLFWMDFRDEILPYGVFNPATGLRSAVNAERTVHSGVEISAAARPHRWLRFDGNVSYNYNRVKDFEIELDGFPVDYAEKKISGFPEYIASLVADFNTRSWRVTHELRVVGRRYMELQNIEDLSLGTFAVGDIMVGYSFIDFLGGGRLTITGRVNNWADKKYESSGYGGNYAFDDGSGDGVVDGWAQYYVAAERNFYGEVRLEFF